jgi:hypothetical protein
VYFYFHPLANKLSTESLTRTVEESGARLFGLEEQEVVNRRKYVSEVRREVNVSFDGLLL